MNWNQFLPKEKVTRSLLPPSSRSLIALRWLMLMIRLVSELAAASSAFTCASSSSGAGLVRPERSTETVFGARLVNGNLPGFSLPAALKTLRLKPSNCGKQLWIAMDGRRAAVTSTRRAHTTIGTDAPKSDR